MPHPRPRYAVPLARHRDLTAPLTAAEHDAFAHWQRLVDARLIGAGAAPFDAATADLTRGGAAPGTLVQADGAMQ